MTLYPFDGQLNTNEIYQAIYNMIISQTVFANPIKGTYGLADKFRKDGSMYGDTKLFYSVKIGEVFDWTNDSEAANLLNLKRADSPACQAVTIDVFKMIWLTVDNFLTKRAWGDESTFSQFNSVVLSTMRETKKVYEATMVNAFIGTYEAEGADQTVAFVLPSTTGTIVDEDSAESVITDNEALNRLQAEEIAKGIADLIVDVQDVSTKYNDLEYLRSYDEGQLMFVWNADWYNKIKKIDLPTIFHNDGLVAKLGENVIPARYFGEVNDETKTAADANTRALKDVRITSGATTTYYRAGDKLPVGTSLVSGGAIIVPSYQEDANVICKVVVPEAIQYMSAFEAQTEFYNPRSLTNTHYLIFGHSDLSKSVLKEFPYITVKAGTL